MKKINLGITAFMCILGALFAIQDGNYDLANTSLLVIIATCLIVREMK